MDAIVVGRESRSEVGFQVEDIHLVACKTSRKRNHVKSSPRKKESWQRYYIREVVGAGFTHILTHTTAIIPSPAQRRHEPVQYPVLYNKHETGGCGFALALSLVTVAVTSHR